MYFSGSFLAGISQLKVNNRNTRIKCEIFSKVNNEDTRTTPIFVNIEILKFLRKTRSIHVPVCELTRTEWVKAIFQTAYFQKEIALRCHLYLFKVTHLKYSPRNTYVPRIIYQLLFCTKGNEISVLIFFYPTLLMHNVPKWSYSLQKSCSKYCKIFIVYLNILGL